MCTNYVPSTRHEISALRLGVLQLPTTQWPDEVFPGNDAPILRLGESGGVLCEVARFGLVPHWCRDAQQAADISRGTYNARSETAATKPSFRSAWQQRQWALAPMQSFFEPCWEDAETNGGRSVRWQMSMADASVLMVAGLWDAWVHPQDGHVTHSFTLLTVNADGHAVMGRMHRPGDEKRMPVVIAPEQCEAWLHAAPANAKQFMQRLPADAMAARAAPRASARKSAKTGQTVATPPAPVNLSLF